MIMLTLYQLGKSTAQIIWLHFLQHLKPTFREQTTISKAFITMCLRLSILLEFVGNEGQ